MQTMEIHVQGKVQKVGFRSCVRRIAQKLCIRGEVMNLTDGSVRIVATGEKIVLDKFVSMVYGCPRAVIRDMKTTDIDFREFDDFTVKKPGGG